MLLISFIKIYDFGQVNLSFNIEEHMISIDQLFILEIIYNLNCLKDELFKASDPFSKKVV